MHKKAQMSNVDKMMAAKSAHYEIMCQKMIFNLEQIRNFEATGDSFYDVEELKRMAGRSLSLYAAMEEPFLQKIETYRNEPEEREFVAFNLKKIRTTKK